MEEIDIILRNKYSEEELVKLATKLDKEFRVNYFWNGWEFLGKEVFSAKEIEDLSNKYKYNEVYNYVIMKYGRNETVIKYNLIKEFIYNPENVGLLEFNVGNSRLDIGRVNGSLYAYEIKTELDNTLRLEKQIQDYEKVFEFINVVCHFKHLNEVRKIIPKKVGIISFEINNGEVIFKEIRKAQKNKSIKKEFLLKSLNSKEYAYIIKEYLKEDKVPLYKEERIKIVDRRIKKDYLLEIYKNIVKGRQSQQWNYIKDQFNVILPIEIQDIYSKV
ncbi:sce7726 family protein [Clostridium tertium]|jgi:hypothetical protein|uniref:sce7726 family protein n=1 Tax=Clostridium tertium TaxID=1559 RepID=UPI000DD00A4C|nr:sce7726 family protein [Clostridium tertium]MDB1939204.1 sce7726 family protein [Clostridium tertium]MDU8967455.1 sce7726 family protein [Clostridium sp.]DAO81829.1 MAG TPA: hypothetical protein [Caudoviricetes sp.]